MDLSMYVEGSRFFGFNPNRESSLAAFESAGIQVLQGKDLRALLPHLNIE
jgi:hypothetical protein